MVMRRKIVRDSWEARDMGSIFYHAIGEGFLKETGQTSPYQMSVDIGHHGRPIEYLNKSSMCVLARKGALLLACK